MKKSTENSYQERILKVMIHIEHNIDSDLNLEDLARTACFSKYHFHRIFKGITGLTTGQYIRKIRMDKAAYLLRYTKSSVTEIAFTSGFETVESFIRAFKKRFFLTPYKYRHGDLRATKLSNPKQYINHNQYGGIMIDAIMKEIPNRQVIFVRNIGPYETCKVAWQKLHSFAQEKGIMSTVKEQCGLCYDNPEDTSPEEIRYDACFVTKLRIAEEGEIGTQKIPGGKYASFEHKGSYSLLIQTYQQIYRSWLPQSGYEPKHYPCIEVYLNNPNEVPEDELLTEIQIAIL